jgi:hypothetical protein
MLTVIKKCCQLNYKWQQLNLNVFFSGYVPVHAAMVDNERLQPADNSTYVTLGTAPCNTGFHQHCYCMRVACTESSVNSFENVLGPCEVQYPIEIHRLKVKFLGIFMCCKVIVCSVLGYIFVCLPFFWPLMMWPELSRSVLIVAYYAELDCLKGTWNLKSTELLILDTPKIRWGSSNRFQCSRGPIDFCIPHYTEWIVHFTELAQILQSVNPRSATGNVNKF